MLPSILAKQLQKGISDYFQTTFPMTNKPFRGSLEKMLEKGFLYHEPYIAVRLPFRVSEEMPECFEAVKPEYLPYVHQQKAFKRLAGEDGVSTLIATGTGSGKTECFLYPILDYCYRKRGEKGIKALIIYPMNALASDQARRIAGLIYHNPKLRGNITAGMYVGGHELHPQRLMGETNIITDHDTMLNSPPDILLTNYKMLDYLLVRPKDAALWSENKADTLKYVAVDELHTFDGAQGTDLACLLRRLKARLGTQGGYLCCIGTSATMGGEEHSQAVIEYASKMFGEPFDNKAVVTEDRLTPSEFFEKSEITDFTFPANEQVQKLNKLEEQEDEYEYLRTAANAWLTPLEEKDLRTPEARIELGEKLMHHSFMQSMITLMKGDYCQASYIVEELKNMYPGLKELKLPGTALNALFALISHARSGSREHLRPFLNVQVQLWMRELRHLVAKVSAKEVIYSTADELNVPDLKKCLPVVNCSDCGATGWVSILNERDNAAIHNLGTFYNLFFKPDERVCAMFPYFPDGAEGEGLIRKRLCPECLQVKAGEQGGSNCRECGNEMIDVLIPTLRYAQQERHYVCPFCGSHRGLSLVGIRSTTEISASISQMLTSRFNDDKKTLTFSDNVQDAAHRAGFFNSRTWKFGLRVSIQNYVQNGGAGQNLKDFTDGFIEYWVGKLNREDFVSRFIAPNMVWMQSYENMVARRELNTDKNAEDLIRDIKHRLGYEIMLEYGMGNRIGRTLEKSGCSALGFDNDAVREAASTVCERIRNEIGGARQVSEEQCRWMVIGFLNLMCRNGAFNAPEFFKEYLENNGNDYLLTNQRVKWMPGQQVRRNVPRFVAERTGGGHGKNFDLIDRGKYEDWRKSCLGNNLLIQDPEKICKTILEELLRKDIVVQIIESHALGKVYGVDRGKVFVCEDVIQLKCDQCGAMHPVAKVNQECWEGAPCLRKKCTGSMRLVEEGGLNYYGKLFSSGDIVRINAREHTGLLDRNKRENLEENFKRGQDTVRPWDPNVLSCTPTLEMGIDIGDLSSVVLCSIPPSQSQFLQRTGRAGRKDGNALTLAIANAKPYDLHYYTDPLDMIKGNVVPPRIFLQAHAVLERQFIAYCMDSWIKDGKIKEKAIPGKVGDCLAYLRGDPADGNIFPSNFLNYVLGHRNSLLNSFIQLFEKNEAFDELRKQLQAFVQGDIKEERSFQGCVLKAFQDLEKQRVALSESIQQLKAKIKEWEGRPQDPAYQQEIQKLNVEKRALQHVRSELDDKNVFNFLTDEGLLPNYAFPEQGVILKAILYRKENIEQNNGQRKSVYEYSRAASSAISEFAPNNSFYVDGHKLTIDQVDLSSAQKEPWRFCPNCSHAQIQQDGQDVAYCPRCGSTAWADSGQGRDMLKVQMVYSSEDYSKSLITDDVEERKPIFYCKQLLVDVDEENDVLEAWQMENDEFNFGYEFVKKAILREINFGESDLIGEKLTVAGVEEIRNGFKICRYCGKIQKENRHVHTLYCQANGAENATDYEECLFLYREFQTEILRLLIPATTLDFPGLKTESFAAAFMLGLREYFGNVDHLRYTVCDVPVTEGVYRKQYLVIYDSVPGGTGYLKQLMRENELVKVFERALDVMKHCSCKDNPLSDGCYHCLFAYKQNRKNSNISRRAAMRILEQILKGKDHVARIEKLKDIQVNSLLESELESRFISALGQMGNEERKVHIERALVHNREGYILKINDSTWEIEPQVELDQTDNVRVQCRPDFIIRRVGRKGKEIAIFTDGFQYHKDRVADDTLKREAIRRSGKYRVWVLSWRDVLSVTQNQGDYAAKTLIPGDMFNANDVYHAIIQNRNGNGIQPDVMSPMELLMRYLQLDENEAERIFKVHAEAYSFALLDKTQKRNKAAFDDWIGCVEQVKDQTNFTDLHHDFGNTIFGKWNMQGNNGHVNEHITVYSGCPDRRHASVSVCIVLNDQSDKGVDRYEANWNGFWHFFNLMQFFDRFIAVSKKGLEQSVYEPLSVRKGEIPVANPADPWNEIKEILLDDEAIKMVDKLRRLEVDPPDMVGDDLMDNEEVIATVELAWSDRKVCFMTKEQSVDRKEVEAKGWKVFTSTDEIDISLLRGENNEYEHEH